ncbi:hypothetical protein ACFPJ1_00055 [Kribbella qitaiheensis]
MVEHGAAGAGSADRAGVTQYCQVVADRAQPEAEDREGWRGAA